MLFLLKEAEDYFRSLGYPVESNQNALRWEHHGGTTTLEVEKADHRTRDGLLIEEVVTLKHRSPLIESLPREGALVLNRLSTISTLMLGENGGPAEFVSKVGIFSQDREAAERLYTPLLCQEAAIIGWHAAVLGHRMFEIDPEQSPLHQTNGPSPYGSPDLEMAKAATDGAGCCGTLSPGVFTVEFEWDPGAVSMSYQQPDLRREILAEGEYSAEDLDRLGGRTCLFQVHTNERHSLYGNGVLCTLELPVTFDPETGGEKANDLNLWELSGLDLPPLFGSWCIGPRGPTFVTFIPNQFCLPGLLQNLTTWAYVRSGRVREWLTASQTRH